MTRRQEPAGGWPWNRPGYTFSIGWPEGYVPRLADQLMQERSAQASATATRARAACMEANVGWGSGTMGPLSNKSDTTRDTTPGRAPMQRQVAQARGLARYWTGQRCVAGHRAERYTSSGQCVQCEHEAKERRAAQKWPFTEPAPRSLRPIDERTYLGVPCKRGHDGRRYTTSRHCVHCVAEKNAARRGAEVPA